MNRINLIILFLAISIASCTKSAEQAEESGQDTVAVAETDEAPSLEKVWETDTILITNESVLYDADEQVLYVSNIAGRPTDKDGVGYISKLNPDGSVATLKWVDGLNAPKGMAILNGSLFVTDIDELVEISLSDGSVAKTFPIEGAQFLNDVATDGENVYFSDMNTGKIHVYNNGEISIFKEGLDGINGLAFNQHGEIHGLDNSGLRKYSMEDDEPQLVNEVVTGGDGLVVINDSTFIASRWQGEIYLIKNGKEYLLLDTKDRESNTADIGYIPEEQLVLVPTFFKNKVVAYKLTY